jgi:hypothetical protein
MAFKPSKLLKFSLAAIVLLAILVYGANTWWLLNYGSSPNPISNAILDIDQHFTNFPPGFPPDPGKAGKETITGIDTDHDGVRDDVQRWIYAFLPNEPQKQMALRQKARYFQNYALNKEYDFDFRMQSYKPLNRANQCARKVFEGIMNDSRDGYVESVYLKAKVLNTYSRVKLYWENNRKITTKEVSGKYRIEESPCDDR